MRKPLVLASTSRYRKTQLEQLCANFICIAPDIDESPLTSETPESLSIRLALSKAETVASQAPENALIIGADQCASFDNSLLGKPLTAERAMQQLRDCSGRELVFYSGLCVLNNETGEILKHCVETKVQFRDLSSFEIESYIKREQPLDCAGSFKCEGLGISLFDRISSEDPSALIGLPLIQLNKFLLHFGYNALLV